MALLLAVRMAVENYFNYFTEIEQQFQRRRGAGLLLSTLDWALIETWKEAGIPLEAVLRGIDAAFDTYDRKPSKTRKVNSLAYCSQEVLAAAEDMKEAAVGSAREKAAPAGPAHSEVADYLHRNASTLRGLQLPAGAAAVAQECAAVLENLAQGLQTTGVLQLEDLERHLTVLERKLLAALIMNTPDSLLVRLRAEADREIAPYRSKMPAAQIQQLHEQFLHKRLFENAGIPRLSLFYM